MVNSSNLINDMVDSQLSISYKGESYYINKAYSEPYNNSYILVAQSLQDETIFTMVDPIFFLTLQEALEYMSKLKWYPMELYKKRHDPMFKAIYE